MIIRELLYKSAGELHQLIKAKELSPCELLDHCLARLEDVEPRLNCFVTVTEESARAEAKAAEKAILEGGTKSLVHGIPISIKDLIAVGGVRYASGSRAMADNIAGTDAPAVERLRDAGAVIIGKTTTSEFGCKPVGDSPLTGITRNPWNLEKTPGGSSAGAAASVASGVTPWALGTDGGGSVRIPASMTGLFGMKAQFGRVPVFPTSATPTLAHVGPLTRTVRDAAMLLNVISGFDRRDPFSVAEERKNFCEGLNRPNIEGMVVAWSKDFGYASPGSEVVEICERAMRVFEELGCEVVPVDRVMDRDPSDMWMAEFYAGVGTRLKKVLAEQPELLDPAVVEVLDGALDQTLEEYYTQVFNRYQFRDEMRQFLNKYDLLASPVIPVPAFDTGLNVPPELPDANVISWVSYTYPFNLTGNPAASLPVGFTADGLPVGLQLVSNPVLESDILHLAMAFEGARPWADKTPDLVT